eukprot:1863410-Rhodomonas_salina.2
MQCCTVQTLDCSGTGVALCDAQYSRTVVLLLRPVLTYGVILRTTVRRPVERGRRVDVLAAHHLVCDPDLRGLPGPYWQLHTRAERSANSGSAIPPCDVRYSHAGQRYSAYVSATRTPVLTQRELSPTGIAYGWTCRPGVRY